MEFNYEDRRAHAASEDDLMHWIAMLHGVLVNSGAWDKLAAFDTETAQQLEILADCVIGGSASIRIG